MTCVKKTGLRLGNSNTSATGEAHNLPRSGGVPLNKKLQIATFVASGIRPQEYLQVSDIHDFAVKLQIRYEETKLLGFE